MEEFINHNQGAIMVILTLCVVVSSFLSWYWSKKQLNQLRHQWKVSQSPYIVGGIEGIDTYVYLSIVNTGNEPATNVKIKFENDFIEKMNEPEENKAVLKNFGTLGFSLIPQKTIYIPTYCRYSNIENETLRLVLSYSNIHGDTCTQELSFNLKMYADILTLNHYESKKNYAIQDNKNSLKSISDSLRAIVKAEFPKGDNN